MNASQVIVQGTLKPDGSLELDETPGLPPGPVEVLIRKQQPAQEGSETWWEYLERSRAELLLQRNSFRGKQEIDADRGRVRSADEARGQAIRRLQTPKE